MNNFIPNFLRTIIIWLNPRAGKMTRILIYCAGAARKSSFFGLFSFFFAFFKSIKRSRKRLGQYPAILTSNIDLFILFYLKSDSFFLCSSSGKREKLSILTFVIFSKKKWFYRKEIKVCASGKRS